MDKLVGNLYLLGIWRTVMYVIWTWRMHWVKELLLPNFNSCCG